MDSQRAQAQSALAERNCGTEPALCRPEHSISACNECVCPGYFGRIPLAERNSMLQVIGAWLRAATTTR
jgi:hypothetical protein